MPTDRGDFTRRFGERLRELREARGVSQEQLAATAGLHRTHVSLIERNRRAVRLDTLDKLAQALGVGATELISSPAAGLTGELPEQPAATDLARLNELFPAVRQYQELASRHGIADIFQDNGGKLLQTLLILGLAVTGKREGNDAKDLDGNEYELKTVNIGLASSFSTHHHLNPAILQKYRAVKAWYFSMYRAIELVEIYRLTPNQLEEAFFAKWEAKWYATGGKDINNPKIAVRFVRANGELVYQDADDGKI